MPLASSPFTPYLFRHGVRKLRTEGDDSLFEVPASAALIPASRHFGTTRTTNALCLPRYLAATLLISAGETRAIISGRR